MAGRVEGKVAFITGVARGQGRAHAVRLAEEGADIIGVDLLADVETIGYPMASAADLAETVAEVEKLGRRIVTAVADVRDEAALAAALDAGATELGRLDIVVANAGVSGTAAATDQLDLTAWRTLLDIDLTGCFLTAKVAIPHLVAGGRGGSIILTSSMLGLKGQGWMAAYVSAKHGLVGLMRSLANELAGQLIRVNSVHPGNVNTPMVDNESLRRMLRPDLDNPTIEDAAAVLGMLHLMPVPLIEAVDVANAVLFLASDEARYITGVALPVDAGATAKG
ncbi:mycofactocin-coupled SDR family oxidoreductase [Frankia sp. CNm7]|uniref:Mycofactocin-coupled SDR family oxidoreductase n=1 Tax=Frankia nepalensis TaxID=1836974 RepID=A0A937UQ03_9ACTN|nr:mycofactocin-coupled SDR family oxidoreductase [Frankia nepalensis]MBL7501736.1 mycofactocin-coupled SDR family oxidoreductase [Frankia nepalensis]MBL7514354.1 mycofactocin-coupled SDR family oxidoreductase [Frankia nepalensis]MBL7523357.1 mycofactocin-coupled SDR family oxidoreductase [Frankia nepalensis]MBL7631379.1 mycofactocin-coupled SDR family oxidoreductase [Frankia nepalensis]